MFISELEPAGLYKASGWVKAGLQPGHGTHWMHMTSSLPCVMLIFVDGQEEMMKNRSDLKNFGSLNDLLELFRVQSMSNLLSIT
jgi:hypothetical protein